MLHESNRTESKSVLNDRMEKEMVAFLYNQEGGILYIGLDDDGHPVGSVDLDSTQRKIADRIKNSILPAALEKSYCSTNRVWDKMKIENVTRAKATGSKRAEKNLVAPAAMREAIVNCSVHNDYTREIPPVFEIFSDKIVMTSYGGLIPGQSEADFFSCSSLPRKRELMRVFRDTGLVEQPGSGMEIGTGNGIEHKCILK